MRGGRLSFVVFAVAVGCTSPAYRPTYSPDRAHAWISVDQTPDGMRYVRDGQTFLPSRDGLLLAVQGNADAERAVRLAKSRSRAAWWVTGATGLVVGGLLATGFVFDIADDDFGGWATIATSAIMADLTGTFLSAVLHVRSDTYARNAIAIYNDAVLLRDASITPPPVGTGGSPCGPKARLLATIECSPIGRAAFGTAGTEPVAGAEPVAVTEEAP
jgi:hypothetical protein